EQTWRTSLRLQLTAGERSWSVKPDELGLILDSHKTAERARAVGMAGLPFGYSVEPVVDVDLFVAQNYLLNLTEEANYAAYNAGYRWEGDRLVGVEGRPGAVLDVGSTVERLREN